MKKNDELKPAASFMNVYEGIDYGMGVVNEIYPDIDTVTVGLPTGEVQHLRLSKVCAKAKRSGIQQNLGEMD